MPNIKSSKKAVKVIAKKTANNHELKMRVQNLIKNCEKAIAADNVEEAQNLVKDGLIKKNTADRQKARLTQKVKNMK